MQILILPMWLRTVDCLWSLAKSTHCFSSISSNIMHINTAEFYIQMLNLSLECNIWAAGKTNLQRWLGHLLKALLLWQGVVGTPTDDVTVQPLEACSNKSQCVNLAYKSRNVCYTFSLLEQSRINLNILISEALGPSAVRKFAVVKQKRFIWCQAKKRKYA